MNFTERLIWAFRFAILDISSKTFCIEDGLESGVREMTVGGAVINLSNLIWPDTSDPVQMERSAFLVQDFQNEEFLSSFGFPGTRWCRP